LVCLAASKLFFPELKKKALDAAAVTSGKTVRASPTSLLGSWYRRLKCVRIKRFAPTCRAAYAAGN
jgi:hypothetical protein